MKKTLIFLIIASILVACNENSTELNKDISVPVSVKEIKLKSIEKYFTTTGTVTPVKEVSLKSEISGKYNLKINVHFQKIS